VSALTRLLIYSEALEMVAASLVFNGIDEQEGYEAFDDDGDGKVSLQDLVQYMEKSMHKNTYEYTPRLSRQGRTDNT
jgi:Ca2+-binding EF-hand superfamily protein